MLVHIQTFWCPKAGHAPHEYEDAFAVSAPDAHPFRAAVADGATESAFSGGWARALAEAMVTQGGLVEATAVARRSFTPPNDGRWYVQAKAAEGSHAALLGLELDDCGWRVEAVGDCCMLHVRDGVRRASVPMSDPDAFHHRPPLISSLDEEIEASRAAGRWEEGDVFILATDALAAWLLGGGLEPLLQAISARDAEAAFARLIQDARKKDLRNDDVTALLIQTRRSAP